MLDFQQRVIAEKRDLDERKDKLEAFISRAKSFQLLPVSERDRLSKQFLLMCGLSEVLGERIAAFAPEKAASHPDVPRPSNDDLVELALQVCYAIERCGASPELTHASMLASDLHTYLRKPG